MEEPHAPPIIQVDPLRRPQVPDEDYPKPPRVTDVFDVQTEFPPGSVVTFMLMAIQHFIVSMGQPVLIAHIIVPLMGGGDDEIAMTILVSLFISGVVSLIQCFLGTLLPLAMTFSSYAYIIPIMAIAQRYADTDPSMRFAHTMRHVQGALMVASVFQLAIASLGVAWFGSWLSPLFAAPLVILCGLGFFSAGFPQIPLCSEIALPTLVTVVLLSIFVPYIYYHMFQEVHIWSPATIALFKRLRLVFQRFGILASLGLYWLVAHILSITHAYRHRAPLAQTYCHTERSGLLRSAPGIWFPQPLQWGTPIPLFKDWFPMIAASVVVSTIESSGGFIASARLSGACPIAPFALRRGAVVQAFGSFLGAMFGTVTGITTSIETVGLVGLTHLAVRDVTLVAALLMILCSLIGKVGIFFASIPFPVVAAWYCIFCSNIVSSGFSFLQYCNMNNRRNITILGFSNVMGLVVAQYCRTRLPTSEVTDIVLVFGTSAVCIGIFTAFLLDLAPLDDGDRLDLDSGSYWFTFIWRRVADDRVDAHYSVRLYLNDLVGRVRDSIRGWLET